MVASRSYTTTVLNFRLLSSKAPVAALILPPPAKIEKVYGDTPPKPVKVCAPFTNITPEELGQIGEGEVAYLKLMRSEDIRKAFPQAPELAPGLKLFALLSADGTPILLADSKAAALANAWEQELVTVSLH